MRMLSVVVLALGVTSPLYAQQGRDTKVAPDGIIWATSWEEALKEAALRNVPIHFTVHKDG